MGKYIMKSFIERIGCIVLGAVVGMMLSFSVAQQAPPPAPRALEFPPLSGNQLILPVAVYDGDTIEFDWLIHDRARMFGLNAPEIHGPQTKDGLVSKAYLEKLLPMNKPTVARVLGRDKFGRALLEIFNDKGESISDLMISAKMASPWDGKGDKPVPKKKDD